MQHDWMQLLPWAAGAVVAAGILFALLRFLHKRLNIFTQGTVTFMVVVVVITGLVSWLDHLQDIQQSEIRIRREAQRRSASSFVRKWLVEGVDAATAGLGDQTEDLESRLEEIERDLERGFAKANARARGLRDRNITLVAASMATQPRRSFLDTATFQSERKHWRYSVLLHDGRSYHVLEGEVTLEVDDDVGGLERIALVDIECELRRGRDESEPWKQRQIFLNANVFRSDKFEDLGYRRGVVLRSH